MNDDGSLIPLQNVKDALQAKQEPFYIGMEKKNALDVIQAIKNGNIAFAAHMIFENKSLWLGSAEPSMSYEDLKDKLKYDKGTNKFSWVNRNSVKKELTPSQIVNATNLKDYDVDSEVIEPTIGRKERGSNKKIKF
jgi:hypothetical protein